MRLIIVSGRSGSGKSTALDVLEDNGFYCIDNLPAGLLPELAERALLHTEVLQPQVAVSIDARNLPTHLQRFPELLAEVRARHIQCDVLYLDADEETLLKRFSETRRRHPLTDESRSLAEAIRDESLLLEPISDLADLKIDTYRSSGAGGQHVNTTDSAVRITHIPTNIIVACQNQRSQHQNRDEAWKMLRARLYEHELRKREEATDALNAQKTDNAWGHQIRSYVLAPYQMVKDLRTGAETSDTKGVLDGDIDMFVNASLAARVKGNVEK